LLTLFISIIHFNCRYRDEDNQPRVRYFDYLSNILSHDSRFATDCMAKLLADPFMGRFREICFWSDCGPHFRSAEMMHFILQKLSPLYPSKIIYMNFFTEYHGKSLVDGHFGLLSRWFKDGEAVRNIFTIDDLAELFRAKVRSNPNQSGTDLDVAINIYSRSEEGDNIHRLVIKNFKSYMSFVATAGKLYISTRSTLIWSDYTEAVWKESITKDKRRTKYAPERQPMEVDIPVVMGARSRIMMLERIRLTEESPETPVDMEF
jgi:hypothetical protein